MLSKTGLSSHVSLGRHFNRHMRYPPQWGKEAKLAVLQFAKKRSRIVVDGFHRPSWEGWIQYQREVKKARQEGYDYGYLFTLLLAAWRQREEEEFGQNPQLRQLGLRFRDVMGWKELTNKSSGKGRVRYRLHIGYDGRSYVRRYQS